MKEDPKIEKPAGPNPDDNPELFDDYDFRDERKATPGSEAYYKSLMAAGEAVAAKEAAAKAKPETPDKVDK